jgi:hypothetical protein
MALKEIPTNIESLHAGEEKLRMEGIKAIQQSETLSVHLEIIERSMNLIEYFARVHPHSNDDEMTIQLLGIRLFNGAASALKLLLSGYYQNSVLVQRDLLETIFLLDYFSTDEALIAKWRNSSDVDRLRNFKPVAIRETLDKRDGFTERRREAAYKLLCEMGAHATFKGFRMLIPTADPKDLAHIGPFFSLKPLEAVLSELAKHLVQAAGGFTKFFSKVARSDYEVQLEFMDLQGKWFEKFYGRSNEAMAKQIAELRALMLKAFA